MSCRARGWTEAGLTSAIRHDIDGGNGKTLLSTFGYGRVSNRQSRALGAEHKLTCKLLLPRLVSFLGHFAEHNDRDCATGTVEAAGFKRGRDGVEKSTKGKKKQRSASSRLHRLLYPRSSAEVEDS
jgi:hypothetical protein